MDPMVQAPVCNVMYKSRPATAEEQDRFNRTHYQLQQTPGYRTIIFGTILPFYETRHEQVHFAAGTVTAVEILPVLERLVAKMGPEGKVAYRHIGRERAVLARYFRERKAYLAAFDQGAEEFTQRIRNARSDEESRAIFDEAYAYLQAGRPPAPQ